VQVLPNLLVVSHTAPPVVRLVPYAIRNTQYAIRNTQYAIRNTQYAIRNTQYAIRNTQCRPKLAGQYAIRNTQYATGVKVGWPVRNTQHAIRNAGQSGRVTYSFLSFLGTVSYRIRILMYLDVSFMYLDCILMCPVHIHQDTSRYIKIHLYLVVSGTLAVSYQGECIL